MPRLGLAEVLDFLEKNASNDKFQIAYGLVRDQSSWRLLNCVINFLEPEQHEPKEFVYGDQVALVREIIPLGLPARIREIIESKSFQVEKFSVNETVSVRDDAWHYESGWETAYLGGGLWPYFAIEMSLTNKTNRWGWETIASEDLPVFPGMNAAMNFLTGFNKNNWEYIPGIMAPIQDFRGRIEQAQIDASTVRVKIDSLKLKHSELVVKAYAESEKDVMLSEGLKMNKSGYCKFNVSKSLVKVALVLLEKGSDMPIDAAEWSPQRPSHKFEVKGGTGLESLVTQGESETVEYKVEIDRDDREEFMETISSFANTGSGVIVLGVNDRLEIVGFERKKEDIAQMIDDGMDPVPLYRSEEANYRGKRLLLVYVEKGNHPPYMSKRTKKAYGRRRGNDYYLSSSEIRNLVLGSDSSRHSLAI